MRNEQWLMLNEKFITCCSLDISHRRRTGRNFFHFEIVVPLVEIKIAAAPLGFTTLEIHNLGTEEGLGRIKRLAVIGVDHQPPVVNAAKVKPFLALVAAVR